MYIRTWPRYLYMRYIKPLPVDILQGCVHSMDIKVDDAGDFFEAVAALKQVRGWLGVVSV